MNGTLCADSDHLPPGQSRTMKFPVVGEKRPLDAALDLASWELRIEGCVEKPLSLSYAEILALPQAEVVVDIHCVTGWSHFSTRFEGTPLSVLLRWARPGPEARFVRFEAYSERRHDTSLPLQLAQDHTWIVHSRNGERLEVEHGFPLRTLLPSRYFYKSLKWLHRIELMTEDRLGFWERDSNYHNNGNPWAGNERFTTGSLKPHQVERFREASSFAPWKGKVLLGIDLRNWQPQSLDLREIQLKNCDLRGAKLAGANLRDANLSLSDLRGADLRGASLQGADVEGVDFSGADLRDADLRGSRLTATRFFGRREDGSELKAQVAGLDWSGSSGVLEDQAVFLSSAGDAPS